MRERRADLYHVRSAAEPSSHTARVYVAALVALAALVTLVTRALAQPSHPSMVAAAGLSFGAAGALALIPPLLILAFTKGAFAWVIVINTGTSVVGAPHAPDMDRRVHRPPRARPGLQPQVRPAPPARLQPSLRRRHPCRLRPRGLHPGAALPAPRIVRRTALARGSAATWRAGASLEAHLEPEARQSSATFRIPASAAPRAARR
jgi:hypothetical protein